MGIPAAAAEQRKVGVTGAPLGEERLDCLTVATVEQSKRGRVEEGAAEEEQ